MSPFAILFYLMFRRDLNNKIMAKRIEIVTPKGNGFHNFNDFFVFIADNSISVFSSKCTHLGCKLMESNDTVLICPCHGSKFTKSGQLISGPAATNLKKFDFEIDKKNGRMVIYTS